MPIRSRKTISIKHRSNRASPESCSEAQLVLLKCKLMAAIWCNGSLTSGEHGLAPSFSRNRFRKLAVTPILGVRYPFWDCAQGKSRKGNQTHFGGFSPFRDDSTWTLDSPIFPLNHHRQTDPCLHLLLAGPQRAAGSAQLLPQAPRLGQKPGVRIRRFSLETKLQNSRMVFPKSMMSRNSGNEEPFPGSFAAEVVPQPPNNPQEKAAFSPGGSGARSVSA